MATIDRRGLSVEESAPSLVLDDIDTAGIIVLTDLVGGVTTRTVTGTANEITVTNGDGVSGNPTISIPNGVIRERLTAARTYYVRTDGSNSNTGLVNSAGGAFLTVQKAADVIMDTLDLAGFVVAIQIADGTYTAGVMWDRPTVGAKNVGSVIFSGNMSTPASVLFSSTTGPGFQASGQGCNFTIQGMTIAAVYGAYAIYGGQIHVGGQVVFSGVSVGASIYCYATRFGYIEIEGTTTFNGAGTPEAILEATHHGNIRIAGSTQGLTGAITTTVAFAYALTNGDITVTGGASFFQVSGTTTGNRYLVSAAVIQWSGGGATSFPGTVNGTTTFGGQFVI